MTNVADHYAIIEIGLVEGDDSTSISVPCRSRCEFERVTALYCIEHLRNSEVDRMHLV